MDEIYKKLSAVTISESDELALKKPSMWGWRSYRTKIRTQEELDYAFQLHNALSKMSGIDVRVESPWISIYANDEGQINLLASLNTNNVKYVSAPPKDTSLISGTVIMPKIDYDFRITLGKTSSEHSAFLEWADSTGKVRITKSCRQALTRSRSWGGTHFYLSGEKMLLVAKMHLGGSIAKIERIIKA
jgi:hypothetical protein